MVQITQKNNFVVVDVLGFHKLWALKHQLRIPKKDIVAIYQNQQELKNCKGLRFGTHIPNFITAGSFSCNGATNFWDVMKKANTLIFELKNNTFKKLYLEVENPNDTLNRLKKSLQLA